MPKKARDIKYYAAVGRRKEAIAQVRLYIPSKEKKVTLGKVEIKTGQTFVNGSSIDKVFPTLAEQQQYISPLRLTGNEGRFAISIKVSGGGKSGQLAAIVHGISTALVKVEGENYKSLLKKQGLLRRDARTRQRRMVGMGGKARRKKQSPKR